MLAIGVYKAYQNLENDQFLKAQCYIDLRARNVKKCYSIHRPVQPEVKDIVSVYSKWLVLCGQPLAGTLSLSTISWPCQTIICHG